MCVGERGCGCVCARARVRVYGTWACSSSLQAVLEDAIVAGGVAGFVTAMARRAALVHRDVNGTGLASSPLFRDLHAPTCT